MNQEIDNAVEKMRATVNNLEKKFGAVRAGRANPSSLDGVMVEYYGQMTPLKQLGTISVPEGNQLLIKPFDRSCLKEMEKAIIAANLGYNPSNDGETIRIVVPALTEERRKELVKQVKALAEEAKIALRNIRQDANKSLEGLELPEDDEKNAEVKVQDLIQEYNKIIDEKLKEKEKDLMTI